MQTKFLSCVESRIYDHGQIYARFHIGSFIRGQALTIANALRRTLLSELPGIVISSVEIQGGIHEFAALPGVQESVMDILLNLKQLVFFPQKRPFANSLLETLKVLNQDDSPNSVFLKIHGPAEVTAADLQLPPNLCCVNPKAHIATVNPIGKLSLNLELKMVIPGQLSSAEKSRTHQKFTQSKRFYLDTIPSPVQKVNYIIHESDTNLASEYISLEIWTDGSVHPTQALQFAIKKLTKLFFNFSQLQVSENIISKKNTNTKELL